MRSSSSPSTSVTIFLATIYNHHPCDQPPPHNRDKKKPTPSSSSRLTIVRLVEEQKDKEIRKLKAQLQKEREKETKVRYSSEEFPPLGNPQIARPFMEAEVDMENPNCPMLEPPAIKTTEAAHAVNNKKVIIPADACEDIINPIVTIEDLGTRTMQNNRKIRTTNGSCKLEEEIKGKERMVFNYKSLNDNTYKDLYSLPGTESFIAVYIDDILVFSKNEKEHAKHLEKMLEICEDNGLVLSPTKMKIAVSTIDFLGAVIGEGTIKLQPHIIKKIVNFNEKELKTKKGLRSFLGILNYARNHIPKLGILLRPLYEKTNAHGDKRLKSSDYELVRKIKEHVQNLPDLEIPLESA
ncbi:ORFIII-like polyprotein [Tanacetum coccineum]